MTIASRRNQERGGLCHLKIWNKTGRGNCLPHERGLKLLSIPRAPTEPPVTVLIRNTHCVAECKLFLNDKAQS